MPNTRTRGVNVKGMTLEERRAYYRASHARWYAKHRGERPAVYNKIDWKNKTPEEKRAYTNEKAREYKSRRDGREVVPRRQVDYGNLRECGTCREKKELNANNFRRSKSALKGFQTQCRPCAIKASHRLNLMTLYGISAEAYAEMMDGASCAICYATERLMLDHCHERNKVRSVLCGHCNSMLGFSRDDPETLERAAIYLREHQ